MLLESKVQKMDMGYMPVREKMASNMVVESNTGLMVGSRLASGMKVKLRDKGGTSLEVVALSKGILKMTDSMGSAYSCKKMEASMKDSGRTT